MAGVFNFTATPTFSMTQIVNEAGIAILFDQVYLSDAADATKLA